MGLKALVDGGARMVDGVDGNWHMKHQSALDQEYVYSTLTELIRYIYESVCMYIYGLTTQFMMIFKCTEFYKGNMNFYSYKKNISPQDSILYHSHVTSTVFTSSLLEL